MLCIQQFTKQTKAPVLLELRFYWEETNNKQVNCIVYHMATNVKKENKEGKGDGAVTSNSVVRSHCEITFG